MKKQYFAVNYAYGETLGGMSAGAYVVGGVDEYGNKAIQFDEYFTAQEAGALLLALEHFSASEAYEVFNLHQKNRLWSNP